MADISAKLVKELRDKTGAGMGDCKKALVEADGDMDAAIEILRKKGAASASKRADKAANEGIIFAGTNSANNKGVIIEINCETDFVARNEEFIKYSETVGKAFVDNDINSIEELMKLNTEDGTTIEAIHNEILGKFSEKVEFARFETIKSDGFVAAYVHAGSKLGVLVEINESEIDESSQAIVRDIAMQIAAMNPSYIDRSEVDNVTLGKEKEIYKQQALDSGKKEEIAERIAQGRLEKFYNENCLIEQAFVKDGNKTVTDIIKEIDDATGKSVKVLKFVRYSLGETTE